MDAFEKYGINKQWLDQVRQRCGNRTHAETLERVMRKLDTDVNPGNSKPVKELDEDGNILRTFNSLREATNEYDINYQTAYSAMRQGRPIRGHVFVKADKKT